MRKVYKQINLNGNLCESKVATLKYKHIEIPDVEDGEDVYVDYARLMCRPVTDIITSLPSSVTAVLCLGRIVPTSTLASQTQAIAQDAWVVWSNATPLAVACARRTNSILSLPIAVPKEKNGKSYLTLAVMGTAGIGQTLLHSVDYAIRIFKTKKAYLVRKKGERVVGFNF